MLSLQSERSKLPITPSHGPQSPSTASTSALSNPAGNEHSANFSNAQHQRYGYSVNHQYEKGFAAESAYNAFIKRHISPTLHYFSGLQHMTELEIAKRFSGRCMAYLPLIISCNWATDDRWCALIVMWALCPCVRARMHGRVGGSVGGWGQ